MVTPEFLLVAISPCVSFDTLLGFAFDARQRGLLAEDALAARLDSVGRRAPGRSAVVRVHAALLRDGSDSMFESRVRARLRDAGYTPSSAPHPVTLADGRTVHLDIAFPAEQVAIECQGFIAHHSQQQLDRDARRDNRIALASRWRVLKLTRHRFRHDWPSFLTELDTALEARR